MKKKKHLEKQANRFLDLLLYIRTKVKKIDCLSIKVHKTSLLSLEYSGRSLVIALQAGIDLRHLRTALGHQLIEFFLPFRYPRQRRLRFYLAVFAKETALFHLPHRARRVLANGAPSHRTKLFRK